MIQTADKITQRSVLECFDCWRLQPHQFKSYFLILLEKLSAHLTIFGVIPKLSNAILHVF